MTPRRLATLLLLLAAAIAGRPPGLGLTVRGPAAPCARRACHGHYRDRMRAMLNGTLVL
jgi:hypothetical protein